MTQQPTFAAISALLAEPAREKMLIALLGGKALTATEMSLEAGVTAATTSSHLAKLQEGGLISLEKQGRHRYFSLRDSDVADVLEKLLNLSTKIEHSRVITGPKDPDLKAARVCYDHLAGKHSVALLEGLRAQSLIQEVDKEITLTDVGTTWFQQRGADIVTLSKKRRPLCKNCLDWSERRHHLAGALGAWVLQDIFEKKWARQDLDSRTVRFSTKGLRQFTKTYQPN